MNTFKYCPICRASLIEAHVEGRKRLMCEACGWIYYKNPLPAVACIVKNDKNELLLIKRGIEPHKGAWGFPGGFVEQGETLSEAAERELKEETGIRAKTARLIGAVVRPSKMYGAVLVLGYELIMNGGKLTAGDDAEKAEFFPLNKLPDLPIKSHQIIFAAYKDLS